ncbi:MAG: sigma-54 dependent transcriptional regulator [Planctomycetota bacterium]|nr:sigma-54 dependent transcriptional regulator [Planctomycetota bacterium]
MDSVLIVDDDEGLRALFSTVLKRAGFTPMAVSTAGEAIEAVRAKAPGLVLLDIKLPDANGIDVLEKIKALDKDVIVIMFTGYSDVKDAVRAMKLGAYDYVAKPVHNDELLLTIRRAIESRCQLAELRNLRRKLGELIVPEAEMGTSAATMEVLAQVNTVAPTNMTVIIQGETGTGKEVVARLIHQKSPRAHTSFIGVDCGAIPATLVESELFGHEKGSFTGADISREGRFEQAAGGTLFFDEVTNLPDTMQVKLLRVLEERRLFRVGGKKQFAIDARILAASNVPLREAVAVGKFRNDLFQRLNQFTIQLPPLRERREDIPTLTAAFMAEANDEFGKKTAVFSAEALEFLFRYHWPGNVRELKNVVKRAALLSESDQVLPAHLPKELLAAPVSELRASAATVTVPCPTGPVKVEGRPPDGPSLLEVGKRLGEDAQRAMIRDALARAKNNKTRAAAMLKVDRKTLYARMRSLGIE